jgi:hypothetical protein
MTEKRENNGVMKSLSINGIEIWQGRADAKKMAAGGVINGMATWHQWRNENEAK